LRKTGDERKGIGLLLRRAAQPVGEGVEVLERGKTRWFCYGESRKKTTERNSEVAIFKTNGRLPRRKVSTEEKKRGEKTDRASLDDAPKGKITKRGNYWRNPPCGLVGQK